MKQYIDKSAVAAELERRMDELYDLLPDSNSIIDGSITISTEDACNTGKYTALESFRKYVDTLEVKEEMDIDIPNIDDLFEEDGLDPNSKTAKIFKESYYMALERLKEKKGE